MKKWSDEEIQQFINAWNDPDYGGSLLYKASSMLQQLQDENNRLRKVQDNYYLLLREGVLNKNRERRGIIDFSQEGKDNGG